MTVVFVILPFVSLFPAVLGLVQMPKLQLQGRLLLAVEIPIESFCFVPVIYFILNL